ncbi:Hypothetical_protein [Hexamita inflata]|uniref:Hypothetical_protein n=1 Tax=Hexamita inflata TaxID=28002 RepID=A0AA86NIX5_9EUKA|nr:Hypothetical protein HINF_LOCUS8409 [Hexamita inflata]
MAQCVHVMFPESPCADESDLTIRQIQLFRLKSAIYTTNTKTSRSKQYPGCFCPVLPRVVLKRVRTEICTQQYYNRIFNIFTVSIHVIRDQRLCIQQHFPWNRMKSDDVILGAA